MQMKNYYLHLPQMERILCGYCSYESTEDATILKRTIVAIDANSGQMTELVDLSDSPANIGEP